MSSFKDAIVKHLVAGIQNSSETMEFLREQVKIIYQEERQKWFDMQSEDDIDVEYFCEFYNPTQKKVEKYIGNWLTDLSRQGGFKIADNKCPHSIVSSFDYLIDTCLDYTMEDTTYMIADSIMDELIYEEVKTYEAINLQKEGLSKS